MNNSEGSISYGARIDTKSLKVDAKLIEKEIDGIADNTQNRINEGTSAAEASIQRFQKIAIGAFVAVGAASVAMGVKAVKDAIALNESVNAVEKTFGQASKTIFDFAKTADEAAGLSESAFAAAVVPIGAMLQNMGYEADAAADASIKLSQRAADLASVFNTDLDSALTAIQAGLRGEADPLERFGVGLSEASIQAYAVKEGISAAGAAMSAEQKTVARLGLLFEQTERYAGDFVDTSDQAANKSRILQARFENISASLGQKLLPAYDKLLSAGEYLIDNSDELVDGFRAIIPTVASLGAGIAALTIVQNVSTTATKALTIAQTLLNSVMRLNPLAVVAGAAVALGVAYYNASNASNTATSATESLKAARDRLNVATNRAKELELELTGAQLNAEGAALRVERAQKTYNETVSQYGADSLEAREASYQLKQAQDDLSGATKRVADVTKESSNNMLTIVKEKDNIIAANKAIGSSAGNMASGFQNVAAEARKAKDEITEIQKKGGTVPATTQLRSAGLPSLNIPGRASGGSVTGGRPYVVGENKDGSLNSTSELFIPRQNGTIVNSDDLQGMMGSGRVEYNIGTITIANEVDGERWLKRLTQNQEIIGKGLTPVTSY